MWKEYQPGERRIRTEPEKLFPNESDYIPDSPKIETDWESVFFFCCYCLIICVAMFCAGHFISSIITAGIKGAQ